MKKTFAVLTVLVLMLTAFFCAASAETLITVNGTGETRVNADNALIVLGVSVRDKDVQKAQQMANEKIAAIRDALIALGVKEEHINTNYINIYAIYDYQDDQEVIRSYNAGSSLSIKVTDMDTVGAVIDAAFAAGANTLDGIEFYAEDTDDAEKAAMKAAVADARVKAEVLAEASGLTVTGIKTINEGASYSFTNTVSDFAAGRGVTEEAKAYGGETVVQAAKVVVSYTVSVTFTAE